MRRIKSSCSQHKEAIMEEKAERPRAQVGSAWKEASLWGQPMVRHDGKESLCY
jgi:hypothetical protein